MDSFDRLGHSALEIVSVGDDALAAIARKDGLRGSGMDHRMGFASQTRPRSALVLGVVMATLATAGAMAQTSGSFKLGVVTFLSGPAAESFGVPAWNGGKVLVDALNQG